MRSEARAEIAHSLTGSLGDEGKAPLSELADGLIQPYAARQAIPL